MESPVILATKQKRMPEEHSRWISIVLADHEVNDSIICWSVRKKSVEPWNYNTDIMCVSGASISTHWIADLVKLLNFTVVSTSVMRTFYRASAGASMHNAILLWHVCSSECHFVLLCPNNCSYFETFYTYWKCHHPISSTRRYKIPRRTSALRALNTRE